MSYCENFQKALKPQNLLLSLSFNAEVNDLVPPPNRQYVAVYDDYDDDDIEVELANHMAENYAALAENVDYMHFTMLYSTDMNFRGLSEIDIEMNQNIDHLWYIIKIINQCGVNLTKIVIGLQFFGFMLSKDSNNNEIDAAKFEEILSYNEICEFHSKMKDIWRSGTVTVFNPYTLARDEATVTNEMTTYVFLYENTRSIANKVRIIMKHGVAGILAFPVNDDDYRGICEIPEKTFADFSMDQDSFLLTPNGEHHSFRLLKTINIAIVATLNEIERINGIKRINRILTFILHSLGLIVIILALLKLITATYKKLNARKYRSFKGSDENLLKTNKSDDEGV